MIKLNRTFCFVLLLFSVFLIVFLSSRVHQRFAELVNTHHCQLSLLESDQYFCELDEDWIRRKELFVLQHQRNRFLNTPSMFFQDNYEPTFSCRFEQRLGLNGDGGKWICDVYRIKQASSCLVYSLGSNGEFSFENQTKEDLPHCEIHTFDMKAFNCTDVCTFHPMKIGDGKDGTKTLPMIMKELNHSDRFIDILKIDVEGAEYELFNDLFNASRHLSDRIRQILVEIHLSRIRQQVNNVTTYDYEKIHHLFDLFHANHFVIFHKEVNLYNPHAAFEYSFIRLNKSFFDYDNNSTLVEH